MLEFITITGADESVDPGDLLAALALLDPARVELGILWGGPEKEGRSRFPGVRWLRGLHAAWMEMAADGGPVPQLSLHLCSRAEAWLGSWGRALDPAGILGAMGLPHASDYRRIQMNRSLGSQIPGRELFDIDHMVGMGRELRRRGAGFVSQVSSPASRWVEHADRAVSGGDRTVSGILLDASGGRGAEPESWPSPATAPGRLVGWAGGLRPARLQGQLDAIADAARGRRFWVDMESGARGPDGSFDLGLATEAAEVAREWRLRAAERAPGGGP